MQKSVASKDFSQFVLGDSENITFIDPYLFDKYIGLASFVEKKYTYCGCQIISYKDQLLHVQKPRSQPDKKSV